MLVVITQSGEITSSLCVKGGLVWDNKVASKCACALLLAFAQSIKPRSCCFCVQEGLVRVTAGRVLVVPLYLCERGKAHSIAYLLICLGSV